MMTIKLGPLMTADEAKTRYCPAMTREGHEYTCCADKCMAWMSVSDFPLNMLPSDERDVVMELLADGPIAETLGFCCK